MYKPKLGNKTKHQQQTESSLFSSQCYEYKLNSTDKHKLDHLSDHLHKTIISLRNKKIHLLQKQSKVMTEKLKVEEKIVDLQQIKRKRKRDESTKYEKFMLETQKQRQEMQEKLREVEAEYKNKSNMKDKDIDFSKAIQLKNLQKKTVQLKEEIKDIQFARKQKLLNYSLSSEQQLTTQIQNLQIKKRQLLQQKSQERRKQLKRQLKQLRCDQIKELLLHNNIKHRVKQMFDLLDQCKWKQYKTIQIEQYVISQRRQKKDLFLEISRMNEDLKKMQEQNSSLQVFIQNITINK